MNQETAQRAGNYIKHQLKCVMKRRDDLKEIVQKELARDDFSHALKFGRGHELLVAEQLLTYFLPPLDAIVDEAQTCLVTTFRDRLQEYLDGLLDRLNDSNVISSAGGDSLGRAIDEANIIALHKTIAHTRNALQVLMEA